MKTRLLELFKAAVRALLAIKATWKHNYSRKATRAKFSAQQNLKFLSGSLWWTLFAKQIPPRTTLYWIFQFFHQLILKKLSKSSRQNSPDAKKLVIYVFICILQNCIEVLPFCWSLIDFYARFRVKPRIFYRKSDSADDKAVIFGSNHKTFPNKLSIKPAIIFSLLLLNLNVVKAPTKPSNFLSQLSSSYKVEKNFSCENSFAALFSPFLHRKGVWNTKWNGI